MTVFTRRFTPDDRAESVYHYLPFDAFERGIRLELEYARAGDAVVDLGLVDPVGFRGWSGGARTLVLIGRDAATPGYLDRGVPPGDGWAVVLGLHRVPAAGVPVWVTVEPLDIEIPPAELAPVADVRPPGRDLPAPAGMRWYAGDLHSHTVHSDGQLPLDTLAARAAATGLDFLAVTDHNTVSHHPLLPASTRRHGVTLLPGQEVTTADGHANAFGDIGWVDFRQPATDWVDAVAERGGLLSVNHPIGGDCSWRHHLPFGTPRPALAEVWHSDWTDRRDGGPLAWWQAWGTGVAVGGSDFHRPLSAATLGSPTTWVAAHSPDVDDILAGLGAGRVAVSAGRSGPLLLEVDGVLVAVDADGLQLVCPSTARRPVHGNHVTFTGHHGPHLLESNDREVQALVTLDGW